MRLAACPNHPPSNSAIQNMRYLKAAEALSAESYEVIDWIRHLQNEVVQGRLKQADITTSDAIEYVRLAQDVARKLRELKR